jgi:lactoylglutathione lyase
MDISRTGIILNTENYEACVSFYQKIFCLPVMFKKYNGDFKLTCFKFGGSYLLLENDGVAKPGGKSIAESPVKLRFNVKDINKTLQRLKYHGIDASIVENDWGATINIFDPDGNRIGIRDEARFLVK